METNCSKIVTDFLRSKSLEKAFSPKSIQAYQSDLSDFFNYYQRHKNVDIFNIQLVQIEDYFAFLYDNQYKPSAIARKVSTIRQFYKYLFLNGIIQTNPTRFLKAPQFQKNLMHPLSYNEIQQLITATDNFVFPHNLRLKALVEIAFGAGLRVTELVSLKLDHVKHHQDYTVIKGKGDKERLIPLTSAIKKAVAEYLPYRLFFSNGYDGDFLFMSTGREGHLTRVRFFQLLKQLAVFAGINPEMISPHIFRHSFALALLRGGADLKSLQSLLGHEKIDTVEIYTKVNDDDLWDMVKKHHPLEKAKQHQ